MVLCGEAPVRVLLPDCIHLASLRSIRGTRSPEFHRQDRCDGFCVDPGASDEIIHNLPCYLAGWIFRCVSVAVECASRSPALRRPRILYRLVEQFQPRRVLAIMESACVSFHEAARFLATRRTRVESARGEYCCISGLRHSPRDAGWDSDTQSDR